MSDFDSPIMACMIDFKEHEPKQRNFNCRYGKVSIRKVHKNKTRELISHTPIKYRNRVYEVVSGEDAEVSDIELQVDGISTSCSSHTNKMIFIPQVSPFSHLENQTALQTFKAPYYFKKGISTEGKQVSRIVIAACETGGLVIPIRIYPNTKFTLKLKGGVAIKDIFSGGGNINISLSADAKWNNKKGSIEGAFSYDTVKEKGTWKLDVSGGWSDYEAKTNLQQFQAIKNLFANIYKRKKIFDSTIAKAMTANPKEAKTFVIGFSMDAYTSFSTYWEEVNNKRRVAKVKEWAFGGNFFTMEFTWDFTGALLGKLGFAGYAINIVRERLEEVNLASLKAELKITGSFNIDNLNFSKYRYTNGHREDKTATKIDANALIKFILKIEGAVQIKTKVASIEGGLDCAGIKCSLESKFMKIKFMGASLYAMVQFKEGNVSANYKLPPPEEPRKNKISRETATEGKRTFPIFDPQVIYTKKL